MSLLFINGVTIRIAGRVLLDRADLVIDRASASASSAATAPARRRSCARSPATSRWTAAKSASPPAPASGAWSRRRLPAKQSLLDTVLEGDPERLALLAEAEHAEPHRLAEIHERLRAIGADSAPARAATILAGLGFDEAAQARPVEEFSGGWRMRVALATVLFEQPDLLLLDEPTNHLDLEATLWLEGWLQKFPGAALIVSHDRGLLDRCVHGIAHLDRGKISFVSRRLRRVRAHPHRARGAAGGDGDKNRRAARAHAELRRPLPLQGEQGPPGAGPAQGDRAPAHDRGGGGGRPHALSSSRSRSSWRRRSWRWSASPSATTACRC